MIENKNHEPSPPLRGDNSRFAFRFHFPSQPRWAALKEHFGLICCGGLARFAPRGAMLDDPIRQRLFKADVLSGLFRFNPFVLQNFLALGLKLTVERGVLQQIVRC